MSQTPDPSAARFARVFDVLELLVDHPEGMTLSDIVRHLGMPNSSAHNLLQRMAATGVVATDEGHRYSLGSRAVRLAIRMVDSLEVRSIARGPLRELAGETGEDVYLAVRFGGRVAYVDRVTGTNPITVNIRLGQSLYLHATAVGKLYAAFTPQLERQLFSSPRERLTAHTLVDNLELRSELERIRAAGFSVSREEAVDGIVGYAFPVRDVYGDLVAAVHVSTPLVESVVEYEMRLVTAAQSATRAIERYLGR